jgi:hypothetical protein
MSWASIVKKNIGATEPTTAREPEPTTSREPEPPCDDFHKGFHREIGVNQESLAQIEKEDEAQCRPNWVMLKRPDAPQVIPVFKTREELHAWDYSELLKNQKYSDEVFEQRTQEWRIKNNWHLPPMKTIVSKYEQTRGFYVEHDHKHTPIVFYVTPFSTERDLALTQTQECMEDMLWCLIHSRSDELVACKTVAEFKALFERNIRLEPELRHVHLYNRNRKHSFPLKMLWLLSQKANVFPGKARPGTARWTKDPVRPPSSDYCMRPVFDPTTYSKSMIFFSSRKFRDSNNAIIHGQHGGREETGICVVQQLKRNGDAAPIRWLLSAKQLREMERVSFHPECSPFRESVEYDSDCYGYDDDWL